FGTVVQNTHYDPKYLNGWGKRGYNWQGSAVVQQELRPGLAVTVGYYRTSNGNQTVTDNLAVTPADYDPYCITVPTDTRLPNSGQPLCGLYDVSVAKRSSVDNLVTLLKNYGHYSSIFNGVDVGFRAQVGTGFIQGGVSTGQTVTDNCATVDSPSKLFCKTTTPFKGQTQVKLNGSQKLPWGFNISCIFQNLSAPSNDASYVATNAEVVGLGRNLS